MKKSKSQRKPRKKVGSCTFFTNCPWPIEIKQTGKTFTVSYGADVSYDLSYSQAATQLGNYIMHWLTLDNVFASALSTEDITEFHKRIKKELNDKDTPRQSTE